MKKNINIDLEPTVRQQIAQYLSLILADMYVLYVKTQNFHWNVKDPRFYSLHKFFEEQYEALADGIDEIAERIRMLGERTPATLSQFLEMSSIREPEDSLSGDGMIQELLEGHETIIRHLRDRIHLTDELSDYGTSDLFINRLRYHEKTAWMLRSHLNGG